MPVPGRTTEGRTVPSVTFTAGSAAFTAPAGSFDPVGDPGRTLAHANVPAGRTIATIAADGASGTLNSGTTVTAGTGTATLGAGDPQQMGFRGWSPETGQEAIVETVASRNANLTDHNRATAGNPLTIGRRSRF